MGVAERMVAVQVNGNLPHLRHRPRRQPQGDLVQALAHDAQREVAGFLVLARQQAGIDMDIPALDLADFMFDANGRGLVFVLRGTGSGAGCRKDGGKGGESGELQEIHRGRHIRLPGVCFISEPVECRG